jgi:hypothetical protein
MDMMVLQKRYCRAFCKHLPLKSSFVEGIEGGSNESSLWLIRTARMQQCGAHSHQTIGFKTDLIQDLNPIPT